MKRVLCLRFHNWPVQRLQRSRPAESGTAIAIHTATPDRTATADTEAGLEDRRFVRALFKAARGGPAIVASSRESWQQGVRPGLPLAEARSMIAPVIVLSDKTTRPGKRQVDRRSSVPETETEFFEWCPEADRTALIKAAELTRSFAPIVGLDAAPLPDSLLLDVTACGPLFGGESALADQLLSHLKQHNYAARIAIADSVSVAWALTHPAGHLLQEPPIWSREFRRSATRELPDAPVVILPPGQGSAAVRNLPIAAARIPPADVDVLQQLGIVLCGPLLNLPVADLPSRLSKQSIERIHQLNEVSDELIDAVPERYPIQSHWSSEFPLTSLVEIQLALQQLIEEIAPQLVRRHIGATRITCRFRSEAGTETTLESESVTPLQDATALYEIVRLSLERTPFRDPLLAADVRVQTTPLPATKQKDLFQTDAHLQPLEELAYTINRLTNRLGAQAVQTISECSTAVPEHAVCFRPFGADQRPAAVAGRLDDLVVPDGLPSAVSAGVRRPLRLLPDPLTLRLPDAHPPQGEFLFEQEQQRIRSATGPERIQTEWWQGDAVHRDYYRVDTDRGAAFWIFRDRTSGRWFLHGIFD